MYRFCSECPIESLPIQFSSIKSTVAPFLSTFYWSSFNSALFNSSLDQSIMTTRPCSFFSPPNKKSPFRPCLRTATWELLKCFLLYGKRRQNGVVTNRNEKKAWEISDSGQAKILKCQKWPQKNDVRDWNSENSKIIDWNKFYTPR